MSAVYNDAASAAASALAPPASDVATVAVIGMGYVGLPTALALRDAGFPVVGIDISEQRLDAIRSGAVDLLDRDRPRLTEALRSGLLDLTSELRALAAADAVIIAVPTPVDDDFAPDLRAVHAACGAAVMHARAGQTIVLTSTTYVGTTQELLVEPLTERGFTIGEDIHVAFAPERINPGDALWEQATVPRVLGGATQACAEAAAQIVAATASKLHVVSSPEAAELTKLQENTFRAVNLAFANEMAAAAGFYGVDPVEIVEAASTKPYGYLAHYPGPGVGGHCIPVDPYYLLAPLRDGGVPSPVTESAMVAVAGRPAAVADRALALTAERGIADAGARILLVGVAYKPGVEDHRESPALRIAGRLARRGAQVSYHDPLIPTVDIPGAGTQHSVVAPDAADYDLVVVAVVHPEHHYAFLADAEHVLDATYRTPGGQFRHAL
ncbi:UDP-N-acetyl-D-glucosamine 6-dehydrogenase [Baekduia alba]|uniref:nucleotide sugar dehydrogenase n=1 Tax=Baekduia alba TaxID=2997333 RepID=UPI00233FBAD3|nr:nucleotide sugar dehydrogenase [Baekduia alba]WCB91646.1 UDP-N-acetyl-D-glucosamine 6-dehydrogenase [Baekduia alba]